MLGAILGLGLALLALYLVRAIRTYYSLRHFGGHWVADWSRLWLLRTQGSGEMNKRFTEVNRKYGEFPIGEGVETIEKHNLPICCLGVTNSAISRNSACASG